MIVFKCKMCGGDLHPESDSTTCECEYCGSVQTIPTADNEKKLNLFARAQRLLRACDFDKAAGVYESIVAEFPEEAEAYWGLVLCKYGIEYVDDPGTGRKVPTCHRSSFDSVMDDADFEQVMENSDAVARRVYRDEAKAIEALRKGIIEVSGKEPPYDIFICYKETDANGERTLDSVLAQDIYSELTGKGYRVFFSRITLEDKLGQEYEPYIFAALNSAKVMLAVGTDYESYNAVWVKNEWSRFLKQIASGEKKTLIPCYKNLDAYDMPKEFARLQAQDLDKVGAMQDLMRGIEKIIPRETAREAAPSVQQVIGIGGPTAERLLERGNQSLEAGLWGEAEKLFKEALSLNSKLSEAYLGLAFADEEYANRGEYEAAFLSEQIDSDSLAESYIQKARKYDRSVAEWLDGLEERVNYEKRQKVEAEIEEARRWEAGKPERQARLKRRRDQLAAAQSLLVTNSRNSLFAGLRSDGTVLVNCVDPEDEMEIDVSDWQGIVAVGVGHSHVVGLRCDGTVVATGYNDNGVCNVSDWQDIVSIFVGEYNTYGLKSDGTVVATGKNDEGMCNVSEWGDIKTLTLDSHFVAGIKKDGTVVIAGEEPRGRYLKQLKYVEKLCNKPSWYALTKEGKIIIPEGSAYRWLRKNLWSPWSGTNESIDHFWSSSGNISMVRDYTLTVDGTVRNEDKDKKTAAWRDIVQISPNGLGGSEEIVIMGLRDDGSVTDYGWQSIVAIYGDYGYALGITQQGQIVTHLTNENYDDLASQLSVIEKWKLFDDYDRFEEDRVEMVKRYLGEKRDGLRTELANLRGLFTGKRRKEIEARLAQIEDELKKL